MNASTKKFVPAWLTALVFVPVVGGILYLALYTSGSDPLVGLLQSVGLAPVEVHYAVTVPPLCKALVSYYKNGALEQREVTMLWTTTFASKHGQPVSMSVQNQCDTGTVEAKIFVNGKPFQSASSSAPYGVAVASGAL